MFKNLIITIVPFIIFSCAQDPFEKRVFDELSVNDINKSLHHYSDAGDFLKSLEEARPIIACFSRVDSALFLSLKYKDLYDFYDRNNNYFQKKMLVALTIDWIREYGNTAEKQENEDLWYSGGFITDPEFLPWESYIIINKVSYIKDSFPEAVSFWETISNYDKYSLLFFKVFPEAFAKDYLEDYQIMNWFPPDTIALEAQKQLYSN